MTLLILGLALWWASHLFPIYRVESRAVAIARLGEKRYKTVFALISLAAIVLMVIGYRQADFVNLWYPPSWTVHLNNLAMLVAVALVGARDFRSGLRRYVRHPMLTAVKVWAAAHLLVNGDLASVVLFGGMMGWAVVAMIGSNRRDGAWQRPSQGTTKGALIHAGMTVAIFAVIVGIHGGLLGVWPLPG